MPQDAISGRGPIERIGRSHATVRPAVLVLDGNGPAFVREAAVLHAAAVEVFLRLFFQRHGHLLLVKSHRGGFFQHNAACPEVRHAHQGRMLVKCHPHPVRLDRQLVGLPPDLQRTYRPARLVYQDFGFGLCHRITQDSAHRVLEQAEDMVAIEIQRQALLVGEDNFHGRGIKRQYIHDADVLRSFGNIFCRFGGNCLHTTTHQRCRQQQGRRKHSPGLAERNDSVHDHNC